jgi:hypothetical protein
MALLLTLALWTYLGFVVYRTHRRVRPVPGAGAPVDGEPDAGGPVPVQWPGPPVIPDTVPADWVETYRSENGG